jgi:tellurite resistance-related uncharacterized protein
MTGVAASRGPDQPAPGHEETMILPPGLHAYRRTPDFTEATIPKALLKAHTTKDGTWGLIHVLEGRLAYRVIDPARPPRQTVLSAQQGPGVIEPMILHEVEPLGPVRFFVEFHRDAP